MQMVGDYWTDVQAVFASAIDLPPGDRSALLDERCAGRPDLRAEVESLLAAHESAESFLTCRGELATPTAAAARAFPTLRNTVIGGWRILEPIGSGGMSHVYRAERSDGAFAHQVALKVIHTVVNSHEVARRFVAERQILGALHHPHIVALIDGGTSPLGEAYLVMELVDGVPITQYARERRLGLHDRLRIFMQVCAAVQYAHQNGVVHRDLKPANILVTADGLTKVLDFGVAKLVSTPASEAATAPGALAGPLTPNYASPEQLRGLPVTTASDIYTLGVLLYELLSGGRPYETSGQPLDAVIATVMAAGTRRPSAATDDGGATAASLPYARARLRGDLDAIVLRAMAPEPERRYASAAELGQDLARALEGRPVLAREPSAAYLLRRYAARHKSMVFSGAVALVGILAALALAIWQGRVAERERARAEQRSAEVRQLANALISKIHEAAVGVPGSTEVRQLIVAEARSYLERLAHDASDDPTLALDLARAYRQLGAVHGAPQTSNLGDREGALASYGRGVALLEPFARDPASPPELLAELSILLGHRSHTMMALPGRRAEAERAAREAVGIAARVLAARPDDDGAQQALAQAHYQLAIAMYSPEAERHFRAALDIDRDRLARAPDDIDRLMTVAIIEWALGSHLENYLRPGDARPHHVETRRLFQQHLDAASDARLGPEARGTALNAIGFAAFHLGDLEQAALAYRDSIGIRTDIAERDGANVLMWPAMATTRASLARCTRRWGGETRRCRRSRKP